MSVVAKFSNGYTDEYKGKRDVKAAWMLTLPNGSVYSGHSLSRAAAQKTATSAASDFNGIPSISRHYACSPQYMASVLRRFNVKTMREAKREARRLGQEFLSKCKIEIVDC